MANSESQLNSWVSQSRGNGQHAGEGACVSSDVPPDRTTCSRCLRLIDHFDLLGQRHDKRLT
jgi:hypothetical protein